MLLFSGIASSRADEPAVFHSPLQQSDEFDSVLGKFSSAKTIRSKFSQQRFIKELSKPLNSSGTFVYSDGKGVAWIQTTPFAVAYVITPHGARRVSSTEHLSSESIDDNPIIEQVSATLLSVWSGDASKLRAYFDVYFTGTLSSWQVGLKPKSKEVSMVLSSIVLSGGDAIQSVTILDSSGDRTTIQLDHVETSSELTSDEAKLLS